MSTDEFTISTSRGVWRLLPLLLVLIALPACPTSEVVHESEHAGYEPDDSYRTSEAYSRSVAMTFETLTKAGNTPQACQGALDDAKFNALQDLARQVEAYLDGPLPEFRSSIVKGAKFIEAEPAGRSSINVTAEVLVRDVLIRYESSGYWRKVDDRMKKRVVSVREQYGNKNLRAVGTGTCRNAPAAGSGASLDGTEGEIR